MKNSIILATTTRFLFPLLLMFSVFLLLRGHNHPGGGFVGGLIASSAFALYAIAFDAGSARRTLRADPRVLIGIGLFLAVSSGWLAAFCGKPFLSGIWCRVDIPGFGILWLGTPLVFDIGVYLLVIGVLMLIITSLAEESHE